MSGRLTTCHVEPSKCSTIGAANVSLPAMTWSPTAHSRPARSRSPRTGRTLVAPGGSTSVQWAPSQCSAIGTDPASVAARRPATCRRARRPSAFKPRLARRRAAAAPTATTCRPSARSTCRRARDPAGSHRSPRRWSARARPGWRLRRLAAARRVTGEGLHLNHRPPPVVPCSRFDVVPSRPVITQPSSAESNDGLFVPGGTNAGTERTGSAAVRRAP